VVMKSHETNKSKLTSAPKVNKAWHAVSVVPKGASCEAAHAVRGTRFLSAEAPKLPLAQCTTPKTCTCAYKHYADRRGPPRRKEEAVGLRRGKVDTERRSGDRRKSE
jgi:hypothetical protein